TAPPTLYTHSLHDALPILTKKAKQAIMDNQPELLGRLMTLAQAELKALTVSTPSLDHYIDLVLSQGALGAKLTGGGRGGCFLVLTKTREQAEKIAAILLEENIKNTWIQGLGVYQYV